MRFRGTYNPSFVYMTNDIVYHDGSSYIASKVVTINTPPPAEGWLVLALGGRDGKPGQIGASGQNGEPGRGIPNGGSVGQVLCKTADGDTETGWRTLQANSIGAASANHRHSIAEIDGLESGLSMKANSWHEHEIDQVHGLRTELNLRALLRHSHNAEDIAAGELNATNVVLKSSDKTSISMQNADGSIGAELSHDSQGTVLDSVDPIRICIQGQLVLAMHQNKVMMPNLFCAKINTADGINLGNASTPKGWNDAGQPGDMRWDTNYVYICVARNTWRRSALATW